LALERDNSHAGSKSTLVFKRDKETVNALRKVGDAEQGSTTVITEREKSDDSKEIGLAKNEAIFTWEHLS
jgi:hypothetical protein